MDKVIQVTWHALEQFRERFPDELGTASYQRLIISQEVSDALEAGRYASKQPRWAHQEGKHRRGMRNRKEIDRTLRYVWTPNQKRMYLIDKGALVIRVITSIQPCGDSL